MISSREFSNPDAIAPKPIAQNPPHISSAKPTAYNTSWARWSVHTQESNCI